MIDDAVVEAYNTRMTVDFNNFKKFTPAQRDQVKQYGSEAEALLKNRDLALLVHHFKFGLSDTLLTIAGHADTDNAHRVAIANQLTGIDAFIGSLRRAVLMKNRVLDWEARPQDNS
jgi:hypothetical protein